MYNIWSLFKLDGAFVLFSSIIGQQIATTFAHATATQQNLIPITSLENKAEIPI